MHLQVNEVNMNGSIALKVNVSKKSAGVHFPGKACAGDAASPRNDQVNTSRAGESTHTATRFPLRQKGSATVCHQHAKILCPLLDGLVFS